jgi:hnRNP-L/PTB/hephaestus splicing factor
VTNVLVLKGKNQAFLEMADEAAAAAMVSTFSSTPPIVRGRTVYVQFSNHRELKTDQNHSVTVGPIEKCLVLMMKPNISFFSQLQQDLTQSPSGSPLPANEHGTQGTQGGQGGQNTVLRVIVESLLYPVSLDILYQIFQRCGKVLKIVTFTKNNSFQVSFLSMVPVQSMKRQIMKRFILSQGPFLLESFFSKNQV